MKGLRSLLIAAVFAVTALSAAAPLRAEERSQPQLQENISLFIELFPCTAPLFDQSVPATDPADQC